MPCRFYLLVLLLTLQLGVHHHLAIMIGDKAKDATNGSASTRDQAALSEKKSADKAEHDHLEQAGNDDSKDLKPLRERDCRHILGYTWPTWRKWQILIVMFLIQISINTNASMYANGVTAISEKHHISLQAARVPQLTFLVAYAVGCEAWAPFSEE